MHTREHQEGIALLITLLLMGVLLSIGASLMNITLKQYQFSGLALASEIAFQAANAGMECALYQDYFDTDGTMSNGINSVFDVPGDGSEQSTQPSIACVGDGPDGAINFPNGTADNDNDGKTVSGGEQRFRFDLSGTDACTEISVYKFHNDSVPVPVVVNGVNVRKSGTDCPKGGYCTVILARGYNVGCAEKNAGTNPRIVEREYMQVY